MTQSREHIEKLSALIKDVKFAMLTTVSEEGVLHSRPMATQEMDDEGNLWFLTKQDSSKVREVRSDDHVNLSYANPDDTRYVSVSGTVEVLNDRGKIKELWNPVYKAWFPDGVDDPEIVLLKVRVSHAEYWDTPNGKMVQLAGFLKAVVTGKPYSANKDEHDKIDLESVKRTA